MFGSESKLFINKIFESKRKVEKEYAKEIKLNSNIETTSPKLFGDVWDYEIENEIKKFIFKYKTGAAENKEIKNPVGYFYSQMLHFWQKAYLWEMTSEPLELLKAREVTIERPHENSYHSMFDYPITEDYITGTKMSKSELENQIKKLNQLINEGKSYKDSDRESIDLSGLVTRWDTNKTS